MLTGDAEAVAKGVSKELGIDDYFAQVLPDQSGKNQVTKRSRLQGSHGR